MHSAGILNKNTSLLDMERMYQYIPPPPAPPEEETDAGPRQLTGAVPANNNTDLGGINESNILTNQLRRRVTFSTQKISRYCICKKL